MIRFEKAIMDIARVYGWGTAESRAIVTALEHARAVAEPCAHTSGPGGGGK